MIERKLAWPGSRTKCRSCQARIEPGTPYERFEKYAYHPECLDRVLWQDSASKCVSFEFDELERLEGTFHYPAEI
jgi:hypothetical protein